MGSATILATPPQTAMADDKKAMKSIFSKPLKALNALGQALQHKKKTNKKKDAVPQKINEPQARKENVVDTLVENFHNLKVQNEKLTENTNEGSDDELKHFSYKTVEDDELNQFSYKAVNEDKCIEEKRTERTDSHSSQDSGFSEKDSVDEDDRVLVSLKELKLEDDTLKEETEKETEEEEESEDRKSKKKNLQTVLVSRGPIRIRNEHSSTVHPYGLEASDNLRQINQVNKQTFSGGHVIVNASRLTENLTEVDIALKKTQLSPSQLTENTQEDYWAIVQEYLDEESTRKTIEGLDNPEDILEEFIKSTELQDNYDSLQSFVASSLNVVEKSNPIEEFHNPNYEQFDTLELSAIPNLDDEASSNDKGYSYIFPTPPRSENVPSPMSDSQASFYPSNSEYTLSPQLSSPIHSDYEKYQELTLFDDQLPSCVSDFSETIDKDDTKDKKTRDRNLSTSSMTMKQYKDLQKELALEFSKKECCQTSRKPCRDIFQEHFKKLKPEERRGLCLKVSKLDLKTACGVLHHILLSLSQGSDHEDLQLALFCLIADRVLSHQPSLFVEDFGLSLIKSAALRCPSRPLLTRYLVQCVRTALRVDPSLSSGREYLYREIDGQGDNLLIALTRVGDACADVLSEIVRRNAHDTPLFSVHHGNAEGYSALHVACRQHSAAAPSLHVLHVLLEHAGADLWKGDVKGDDTAVHLAVNSATCDLRLVLAMFKHVDRKMWKKLAHVPNRSSVTPLEYARCAAKSTTRQNYPQEVLEFLKKCR